MPHLPVVAAAGIPEATRVAQTLLHRGAEAGIVVVDGERADRIRAERLPEAGAGERIGEQRNRERRRGGDPEGRRDEADDDETPPTSGGIIDLQA